MRAGGILRRHPYPRLWSGQRAGQGTLSYTSEFGHILVRPDARDSATLTNSLRQFPVHGRAARGARATVGADAQASEWKYVPVRRTALFLEELLYRGTPWVVFEPNNEPPWAQIRLNVGAFMHTLFHQGLPGRVPERGRSRQVRQRDHDAE